MNADGVGDYAIDNDVRLQCAGLGIDPSQLFAGQDHDAMEEDPHELWPENWSAWMVFLGTQSQWHLQETGFAPGRWFAPPYQAVDLVIARYRVPGDESDAVFQQYQVLEHEALTVHNESRVN